MFGAILGDMAGSPYEFDSHNIKSKDFPLFSERSTYTDDTVLTLAIGQALMECPDLTDDALVSAYYTRELYRLGNLFPDAGYGYRFAHWLASDDPKPYHSYGNGAAMRVSAVGWIGRDLSEVRRLAHLSAAVTHDHPEGIKGAEAVACAIFLARQGRSKDAIRYYISAEFGYDLSRSCAEIRPHYHHVESCQETVPQAFAAFFEGMSFEDVLRTAVSLGGDSDTLTAIAASIAEAYYGIDETWKKTALSRLPEELAQILRRFDLIYGEFEPRRTNKLHEAVNFAEKAHRGQKRKGTEIAYITHPLEVMQILTAMQASDELLMAGVLHDTVEDTAVTLEDIRAAFGERVAFLVAAHSEDKSKSWYERKQHTIDILTKAERDVKLLVMADKVANLRSMLDDYQKSGERLWERFNAPKEQQAWYNGALQDALIEMRDDPAASHFYWEMVDICKDLFAEYYADLEAYTIYQTYLTGETYAFRAADGVWEPYKGVIPPAAVRLPRLKAERLEDYWRGEQHVDNAVTIDLGDITTLACDCIVNAANNSLLGGGGVDGAIHRAAGPALLAECRRLNGCATGEAKITKGYDLPARYVIHTVGPRYTGSKEDARLLAACYFNSLELAKAYKLHSIAFPAISTGVYGYPLKEAAAIAIKTVSDWLEANPAYGMEIIFSCYDRRTFQTYQDIFYGMSE